MKRLADTVFLMSLFKKLLQDLPLPWIPQNKSQNFLEVFFVFGA